MAQELKEKKEEAKLSGLLTESEIINPYHLSRARHRAWGARDRKRLSSWIGSNGLISLLIQQRRSSLQIRSSRGWLTLT